MNVGFNLLLRMHQKLSILPLLLIICISWASVEADELIESAQAMVEQEEFEAYRGWLKYLIFDVEVVSARADVDEAGALAKRERLESWIQKIKTDPDVLYKLRGVHEWAYESQADGSGQPFMIVIPQNYDPAVPMPASLYMHGYTGNHSEHFNGDDNLEGRFDLSVLGRSRGGGYVALSEADVLDVLDYVEEHWSIDEDRIHIMGGSMGGNGTFHMGSRYPHRFASGRPTCGFGGNKPFGNLLTLPIYATHSDDDMDVPILHSQGPVERLQALGGQAVYDWTTGYGHAVWDYVEGNERSAIWAMEQVRPNSKSVSNINYTALDGGAMRSWWAEIEEWGNAPKPATFVLRAVENNTIYVTLTNIHQLKLRIDESPIDVSTPLQVSVNGGILMTLPAPIPDRVFVRKTGSGWELSNETDQVLGRRHTPGGPNQLYNGDPLLIVYGTLGGAEENEAMLTAAIAASKSPNAIWQKARMDQAADGIYHFNGLYGDLLIKADVEVTAEEIEQFHLVLIGTARQNSVVASIADRLPVSLNANAITFSDGESYPEAGLGLGLVYYNPDAPENLIFWVASNDSRLYREDSPIPLQMGFQFFQYAHPAPGYDCLISSVDQPSLLAGRSFDSKWNWNVRDPDGKLLASSIKSAKDFITELARGMKVETASDFAFMINFPGSENLTVFHPGVTRLEDVAARYFYEPLGVMNIKGAKLLEMQAKYDMVEQSFYPVPTPETIDPENNYRVVTNQISIWQFVVAAGYAPRDYRLTDIQLSTVVERQFPVE